MLSKLITHEAKRIGRFLLPVFGALLILTALTRVMEAVCLGWQGRAPLWLSIPTAFLLIGTLFCSIFLTAASFGLPVLHFYRMLGQEGYLLFSIPATISQQIWSKLLSACVWMIASLGVFFGCLWALVLQPFDMMEQIKLAMFSQLNQSWIVLFLIMLVFLFILTLVGNFLYAYSCCALGMQFGTNRLLATLVLYFGIPVVLQIVALIGIVITGAILAACGVFSTFATAQPASLCVAFLGIVTIVTILWDVICYKITLYLLSKRLNLV